MKRLKIGDLCELQNGRAFKQSEWQDYGHPIIRIQNLSDPKKGFNYAADGYPKKFWVDKGDILFSWSGTPGTSFGCFRWNGQPGWLNQHIFNMRLKNPEQIDGDYFILAINGVMREIIDQAHGGVGLKHITKAKLLNVEVPFPPLEEQKRIAKILDAADALRAKRRQSLAQLDALLQSTFLDLFGDPVVNDRGWSVARLGDLLDNIDGGWSPKCLDRKANTEEWGVLKLGSVTKCFYDETKQKALPKDTEPRPAIEVREGDLLFSRKNTKELVCAAAYVSATRTKR